MSYPEDTPGYIPPTDGHPDQDTLGDTRADARATTQRMDREQRRALHPNTPQHIDGPTHQVEHPAVGTHRSVGTGRHDQGSHAGEESEIIERLREPDNRARLQLATAFIAAATFVLVLVGLILALTDGPQEPVLVEGVPCLVQDGEDGQSLLYCLR